MPTYRQIFSDCQRKNNSQRLVRDVRAYSVSQYWNSAYGHFMIAGGTSSDRNSVLISKLKRCLADARVPTVILSGDPSLTNALILARNALPAGSELTVFSNRQRNYHFFYGMTDASICRYFRELAQRMGYDGIANLESYINALLAVVKTQYVPSLPALLHLTRMSDGEIAAIGEAAGVARLHLDVLRAMAAAGSTFRSLLSYINGSLSIIAHTDVETKRNLTAQSLRAWQAVRNGMPVRTVTLVEVNSPDPYVLNHYFACELQSMQGMQLPFRLILASMPLHSDDGLISVINTAKNTGINEIGLCAGNPQLMLDGDQLAGFGARFVMPSGGEIGQQQDLANLLECFGTYTHWEPVSGGGAENRGFFRRNETENWSATSYERATILPSDIVNRRAILSGHNGAFVDIVTRLTP